MYLSDASLPLLTWPQLNKSRTKQEPEECITRWATIYCIGELSLYVTPSKSNEEQNKWSEECIIKLRGVVATQSTPHGAVLNNNFLHWRIITAMKILGLMHVFFVGVRRKCCLLLRRRMLVRIVWCCTPSCVLPRRQMLHRMLVGIMHNWMPTFKLGYIPTHISEWVVVVIHICIHANDIPAKRMIVGTHTVAHVSWRHPVTSAHGVPVCWIQSETYRVVECIFKVTLGHAVLEARDEIFTALHMQLMIKLRLRATKALGRILVLWRHTRDCSIFTQPRSNG